MLKLKLQSFGHLMQRADSLEKTLMLGKIEGRRRRGQQRMRWWEGIINSMDMTLGKLREIVIDREAWRTAVYRVAKRVNNNGILILLSFFLPSLPPYPHTFLSFLKLFSLSVSVFIVSIVISSGP